MTRREFKKGDVVWYLRRHSDKNKYVVQGPPWRGFVDMAHKVTGESYVGRVSRLQLCEKPEDQEFEKLWV